MSLRAVWVLCFGLLAAAAAAPTPAPTPDASSDSDTAVAVMGSDAISTGQALNQLRRAGQPAYEAELPLEAPLPRTLIRYSGGRAEALAVQRALGQGELQPGPTPPDTGIAVLLGQDWRP